MAKPIIPSESWIAPDFSPETFGRLTTISSPYKPEGAKSPVQDFVCSCGNKVTKPVSSVRSGNTSSCGCIKREILEKRNYRHGGCGSLEHQNYTAMLQRCYYEAGETYKNYGARGIKVCDRWLEPDGRGFANFLADMGPRPELTSTVERKDPNKDYSPDNCCWLPKRLQGRNQRRSHMVTIGDRTQCVAAWAEEYGIKASTVFDRIYFGWEPEEAITLPVGAKRKKPLIRN